MTTSPAHQDLVRRIFDTARELPMSERLAYLDSACDDDSELRAEVDRLLADHDAMGDFLATETPGSQAGVRTRIDGDATMNRLVGRRIGHFKIRRLIATGGMGAVYEAVQENPRRTVALKLMREGIASRSALRRFEYESQILARLRHPGICQIYEAGVHYEESAQAGGEGVPFFAMEYIPNARAITDYVREKSLSTKQRLELFVKVCEAVSHGHQKGIIHRDLKPTNILVDPDGQPKIIDFGVARSTDSDMAVTTLQTDVGRLIGTLQYMSPEQCEADPHDLDTRSDVYALGVVLFELLCEQLPYDVSQVAVYEAAKVVREATQTRPSTLNRTLRGDIETIALKALEKDRQRRYQSATELGQDITRYLRSEPIEARPPSVFYQMSRFARRHRTVCAASASIVIILTGAMAVSLVFGLSEAEQRRLAEQARDDLAIVVEFQSAQLSEIRVNEMGQQIRADLLAAFQAAYEREGVAASELAEELAQFAISLDKANLTNVALVTLDHTIFERALTAVDEQFGSRPLLAATLKQTLADTMQQLGLLNRAVVPQREALDTRRRLLGNEDPATLESINNMGGLYYLLGDYDQALSHFEEALVGRRRALGEDHEDTLTSLNNVGGLLFQLKRYEKAEPYLKDAFEACLRTLGPKHRGTLAMTNNMGAFYEASGRPEMALPYYQRALEAKRRILGDDDASTLKSINNMGYLLCALGRPDEARLYYEEAVATKRRTLGDDHPSTLRSVGNLGSLLKSQGRYGAALPLYEEVLDKRRKALGNDHADTLTAISNMGNLLRSMEQLEGALPLFEEALAGRRRVFGNDHEDTVTSMYDLGELLIAMGEFTRAAPLMVECVEVCEQVHGPMDPETLDAIGLLITLYENWNTVEPDAGHGTSSAAWQAKLEALQHVPPERASSDTAEEEDGGSGWPSGFRPMEKPERERLIRAPACSYRVQAC